MDTATTTAPPELWTRQEVAAYLRVEVGTLEQWAHRHVGPKFTKVGRYARYDRADVVQWFADQKTGGHGSDVKAAS